MENKNYVIKAGDMEIVDGKVVLSSEELAAAIQSGEIDLNSEESAQGAFTFNGICNK